MQHLIWSRSMRLAPLAVFSLVLAACAPTSPPVSPAAAATSTVVRDGGQVTVAVTWRGRVAGPIFEVALDTHSVDLDSIDLAQQAVLELPGGDVAPSSWDAPRGGHHRSGTLRFPSTLGDGSPTIAARPVQLVIRDVAGVAERRYTWQP